MVIIPDPFHSPPPSAAAMLLATVPPVMVAIPAPVMCNPPPFPGAAVAGATPVLLAIKSTSVSIVVVPAIASIAPPARFEILPEKVVANAVSVAFVPTKTAPPLPLAPFALLLESTELLITTLAPAI